MDVTRNINFEQFGGVYIANHADFDKVKYLYSHGAIMAYKIQETELCAVQWYCNHSRNSYYLTGKENIVTLHWLKTKYYTLYYCESNEKLDIMLWLFINGTMPEWGISQCLQNARMLKLFMAMPIFHTETLLRVMSSVSIDYLRLLKQSEILGLHHRPKEIQSIHWIFIQHDLIFACPFIDLAGRLWIYTHWPVYYKYCETYNIESQKLHKFLQKWI
jgi:hypothetical protein